MYRILEESEYLEDARKTANAAFDLLALKNNQGAFYQDLTWFQVYLYLGHYDFYMETGEGVEILDALSDGLKYAWEKNRDVNGLIINEFWAEQSHTEKEREFRLLDQAGTAESLGVLSQYHSAANRNKAIKE